MRNLPSVRMLLQQVVETMVPRTQRFRVAVAYCRVAARLESLVRPPEARTGLVKRIETWVGGMLQRDAVKIPTRIVGLPLIKDALAQGQGVLFCHIHLPFAPLVLTAFVQDDMMPSAHIAAEVNSPSGVYIAPGTVAEIPVIWSGPNSLLALRSHLRKGHLVTCMLDEDVGKPLNGNTMRIAARLSSLVLFGSLKLRGNCIELVLELPPFPIQHGEDDVLANLAAAEIRRDRWFELGDRSLI